MNWLTNFVRPKINAVLKRDTPDKLWIKCPECSSMIFHRDLEANQKVCPECDHHMRMDAKSRLMSLFDNGEYEIIHVPEVVQDPLGFKDLKRYPDRVKEAKKKTGSLEAIQAAIGDVEENQIVAIVQDFHFMGGSMGLITGETMVAGAQRALSEKCPLVMFSASGGARMQEGILSLMQMPRTTVAVQMLRDAGLPFIVVLTDPTSGGVMASFAQLGDIHIAEPKALLAFSGPRVIENTIREKLPEGFQRSEFVMEKGMIDMVVHRQQIKPTLARILRIMTGQPAKGGTSINLPGSRSASGAGGALPETADTGSTD